MKDELATKLTEILGQIQSSVVQGSDFVLSQLPDVAQQYIIWGRAKETIHLLIGVALAAYCWPALFRNIKAAQEAHYSKDGQYFLAAIFCAIFGLFGAITMIGSISAFLMVWFAPKIYLLKGLAVLLK